MRFRTLGTFCAAMGFFAPRVDGQVQSFVNDFDGWMAATGVFSTIDFETLPDGSPSVSSTVINSLLNYTAQGATFSSPLDDLIIGGNPFGGFTLRTATFGTIENPMFIRADLVSPARAVGYFFGGDSVLNVFDNEDTLLASEFFGSSGSGFFLGVVSDLPIAYVTMDSAVFEPAVIQSFHFAPVPEPATAGLLAVGALAILRRRRPGHRG